MQCTYCKKEIAEGASKCPECSEWIKFKLRPTLLRTVVEILIPVLSLTIAYGEFTRAKKAQQHADTAMEETRQTMAILEEMPRDNVLNSAKTQVDPQIFSGLQKRDFVEVDKQLQARLKENPRDEQAKKGLIYSRVLRRGQ